MKVMNLMTYEEFLSNTKGYKNIGINYYYNYCHYMDSIYIALVKYHKKNNKEINFDRDETIVLGIVATALLTIWTWLLGLGLLPL